MPQDAASTVSAQSSSEAPDFPADTRTILIRSTDFATGGVLTSNFRLRNTLSDVLHVRLSPAAAFLKISPDETALGPGEQQIVSVHTDITAARAAVRDGAAPGAAIQILYQHLSADGGPSPTAISSHAGTLYVHLPIATCPACERSLDAAISKGEVSRVPDVCPYCYERLRPCPVCGTPNSWLARRCVLDDAHVIRSSPDWGVLGGSPAHDGVRPVESHGSVALFRRWSFPSVAPARREAALTWSAPVSAYGMVAAAAATATGDACIYAFDGKNGAPLWDPYPLLDPVYPDSGGVAIASGRLYAATVEGVCVGLDALRGTRLFETRLSGRVFGAIVPAQDYVLVSVADGKSGALMVLDAGDGRVVREIALPGAIGATPAFADGLAFVHDENGVISALDIETGKVVWAAGCGAGFDAAPVVRDGFVYSATLGGAASCRDARTGAVAWDLSVTNAPLAGTPACDGALLYLPADDGLYVVGATNGRAVRRYATRLPVRSSPVIAGGTLFFGATDGCVYGTRAGSPLESLYDAGTVGSQIVAAPALADDTLFVVATNGVLYALGVGDASSAERSPH